MFRPSLHSGFARSAAESAYPELWVGLTGAWVPALGCQSVSNQSSTNEGFRVRDFSGHSRHMVGEGLPDIFWSTRGGPCLETTDLAFSNLNIVGTVGNHGLLGPRMTVVCHKFKTDAVNRTCSLFEATSSSTNYCELYAPDASGNAVFNFGGDTGDNQLSVSGLTYGDDIWVVRGGELGLRIWQNGALVGSTAVGVTRANGSSGLNWLGISTVRDPCLCKGMLTYDRELPDRIVQILSKDILAPFYLKPKLMITPGVGGVDLDQELEQSLNLSQTVTRTLARNVSVASTLAFVSSSTGSLVEEASNELTLVDAAEFALFIGDVHNVVHNLGLTDSAEGDNGNIEETESTLLFTQSVSVLGPRYESASTNLGLTGYASGYLGVPWLPIPVTDVLAFTQVAGIAHPRSVISVLAFDQMSYRVFRVFSTLSLTQTVEYGKGPDDQKQSLGISHAVVVNGDWVRSVVHDDFIRDGFTYYVDSPCARKSYMPFEGGEAAMPEPRLQTKSQFMLETLSGPYLSVSMRNPEMDNRDRLALNRINRETSGGELNIYSDPVWAKVNTLLFTVVASKPETVVSLQTFLLQSLGQEVKLTDWLGSQWRGVVTTPNEAVTEDSDGYWTLSFEFECEPYAGQAPEGRLAFAQEASAYVETPL